MAPRPFAAGSVRLAYIGRRLFTSTGPDTDSAPVHDVPRGTGPFVAKDEIVLKEFLKPPKDESLDRHRS